MTIAGVLLLLFALMAKAQDRPLAPNPWTPPSYMQIDDQIRVQGFRPNDQAERVFRAFAIERTHTQSVGLGDLSRVPDENLQRYVADGVAWAFSISHMLRKLKTDYPNMIEDSVQYERPDIGEDDYLIYMSIDGADVPVRIESLPRGAVQASVVVSLLESR